MINWRQIKALAGITVLCPQLFILGGVAICSFFRTPDVLLENYLILTVGHLILVLWLATLLLALYFAEKL